MLSITPGHSQLSGIDSFRMGISVAFGSKILIDSFNHVSTHNFRNVTLKNARFTDPCGNRKRFDDFFVQQRLIRGVQIPTTIDIREAMKKSVEPPKKRGGIELSKNRQHILKKRNEQRLQDKLNAANAS